MKFWTIRPLPLPSYLIREYLHSAIQYWTVRRLIFEQSEVLPIEGMAQGCHKTQHPHKWGIYDAFPGCYSFSTNLIFLPVSSNRINNLPKVRDDGSALLSRKVLSDIPGYAANCSSLKLLRIFASSIRTRILSSCLFNGSCFFIGRLLSFVLDVINNIPRGSGYCEFHQS